MMLRYHRTAYLALGLLSSILAGCTPATLNHQGAKIEHNANHHWEVSQRSLARLGNIHTVHMIDADNGWALAGSSVLRSKNGGLTWAVVGPKNVSASDWSTGAAAFPNIKTAWVTFVNKLHGNVISVYHTTDGGRDWSASRITGTYSPISVESIDFVNAQDGWFLANFGGGMDQDAVAIYHTSDGGDTWTKLAEVGPNQPRANGLGFGGDKTGLSFSSATNGWVTGHVNPVTGAPRGKAGFWLFRSTDGGVNWKSQSLPIPTNQATDGLLMSTFPPLFYSDRKGILPAEIGQNTIFYRTSDGGASWEPTSPIKESIPWPGRFSVTAEGHIFAAGSNHFYFSANGGETWDTIAPKGLPQMLSQIDFVTDHVGWAVGTQTGTNGGNYLFKTIDGGRSWLAVKAMVDSDRAPNVSFKSIPR